MLVEECLHESSNLVWHLERHKVPGVQDMDLGAWGIAQIRDRTPGSVEEMERRSAIPAQGAGNDLGALRHRTE